MSIGMDQVHRYSLAEYHRLIESGGFDEDARVELIDGLLVDMSPKTRKHEEAIRWLAERLYRGLNLDRFGVYVHGALTIERFRSEPEPDLTVFELDTSRPYHPATAALVIEVSVSSLRHDLIVKHALYAGAGVTEYWVIDVDGERVVRHRDPTADGYREVDEFHSGDTLAALGLELDVRELFAAALS